MNKRIVIIAILLELCLLQGCTTINNKYYQENYGNDCLSTAKTRDDLLLCYVKSLKEEHVQNRLSNNS